MTKVINMFGGPGSRKSTIAAGVFYKMKMMGLNVELASEFAKDVTWEKHFNLLLDQVFVTAHQNRKLERLRGQVDFIICDSPLLLGLIYRVDNYYKSYDLLVEELFNSYDNINFYLNRTQKYNTAGRKETEAQAIYLDTRIRMMLDEKGISFTNVFVDLNVADKIVKYCLKDT